MSAADADFPSDLRSLERQYELIRELGQGGMAAVYLARHRSSGRLVAIKAIRSRYLDDADAIQRFAREARTVAGLEHPNIVRTEAIEQIGDRAVAIIMEHVPGGTVRDRLREHGSLGAENAENILRDVANALGYAHRRGIVHRDVKPENIFLDPIRGRALLSDFGIARKIDTDAGITLLGAALGTPQYMSPEQIDGEMVDGRSDIYSLGVLGWELLTGRRPWAGESLYGVIYKQKHEDLPRITSVRPRVPANLLFAIEGALIKDKSQRWQSMDEFLDQLTYNPPPLLSQAYPPSAVRVDDEPTVKFRSVLRQQEAEDDAEDALWAAISSTEHEVPVEASPLVVPTTRPTPVAEQTPAPTSVTRADAGSAASLYSGDYILPGFDPNADATFEFTTRRKRLAQAIGLLIPLGIAAGSLFVVLGGSANDSTRGRRPTSVTSAGSVERDSAPSARSVSTVSNPPDSAAIRAARPPRTNRIEGVVGGSSVGTGREAPDTNMPAPDKPSVFTRARAGGSTTARSPLSGLAARSEPTESARAKTGLPLGDSSAVTTKAAQNPETHPSSEVVEDPFKIPSTPGPALGGKGSVPSPRCRLAADADQRACLTTHIAIGDESMTTAFESLVTEMRRVARTPVGAPDPMTVQRLRIEQRAWTSIRDSECPRKPALGAGPFWAEAQAGCFNEMARARTSELRDAVRRLERR